MEKYLIIIGILIGLYFIYKYNESLTENFADVPTQNLGGVDDTNAINTLAQIAKQLMTGGVTVPGNINIKDGVLDIKAAGDSGYSASFTGGNKEAPYINFMNKADGKRNGYIMGAPDKFILANNVQVGGGLTSDNNINARTGEFNTRIGGIWTAPGIYAEGDKNLEVGAGSGTVFIGAANGAKNQNLNVTGRISTGVNVWNTSMDGKNRTYYENNGRTYYGSNNGIHTFRDGENGGGSDIMSIVPGKVRVEGRLFIRRPNMQATDGYDGPGQITGTSSLDDCAQKCIDKAPQTQVAMRSKENGFCWCKDANLWMHQNGAFDSMITL